MSQFEADWFDGPETVARGSQARTGILSAGLGQMVRMLVQVVSAIVLSRLLPPSEFGLLAMAGPIVGFVALFQDLGTTQILVQKPKITHAEVNALFAVSLATSLGIAALLIAISPLVSRFYDEPRAAMLTAALGLNVAFGGAASLQYALLVRRLQFRLLAIVDSVAAVVGLVGSIVAALLLRNVWALYVGSVATTVTFTIGYWVASGWRPTRSTSNAGVAGALRFGADVTGYNLINFFSRNLDNVLIGRVWGEQPLGLYDRAYKLLLLPLQQINMPVAKVMLPLLARLHAEPERYRQAFLRTLAQVLLCTVPAVAFMIGTADLLVPAVLGPGWAGTASIFSALGLAGLLQVMNSSSGWLLISQGRTRENLVRGGCSFALYAVAFCVGLPHGVFGVAVAYAVSEGALTPLLWWYTTRSGPVRPTDVALTALPHYTAGLAVLVAVGCVRLSVEPASSWAALALCSAASLTVAGLAIGAFTRGRRAVAETLRLVQHLLRGAQAGARQSLRPRVLGF